MPVLTYQRQTYSGVEITVHQAIITGENIVVLVGNGVAISDWIKQIFYTV